jgi:amidase
MHEALLDLDAIGQAAMIADKQISALELVDAAIARLEPKLNALASTDFEAARTRAKKSLAGPLAGVPFLLKDLLSYPGQRHMLGSRLFAQNVAHEGSAYTRRLDAAGLIPLGKTTTSELGLLGSTETLLSGATHNPWDLTRSATGSSGGSAAAVAARMVALAHASDGGGSVRIPASACGLFGFKPSRGRCVAAAPDDMFGMLIEHVVTRSVRDSALMLGLTEDEGSEHGRLGYVQPTQGLRLRIGFYLATALGERPEPEVEEALGQTVALCRALGHEVFELGPMGVDGAAASQTFFTLAGSGVDKLARLMEPLLGRPVGEAELEPFTLSLLRWYRSLPEGAAAQALGDLERVGARVRGYLDACDVALCPTMPSLPPLLGTLAPTLDRETIVRRTQSLAGYTAVYTMAGVPAMSVPLFASAAGLPIGSHFAAPLGREAVLLRLAYQLEQAAPWAARAPS